MSNVIEHRAKSTVLMVCPKCDSRSIGAHHGEFILSFAWQETFCNDCGAEWVEVYEHMGQEEVGDTYDLDRKVVG